MMISPECFADMHKDETYEELLLVRDELLDSILEFEEGPEPEYMMHPSPDVVYRMDLLYLGKICELISEKYRQERDRDDLERYKGIVLPCVPLIKKQF